MDVSRRYGRTINASQQRDQSSTSWFQTRSSDGRVVGKWQMKISPLLGSS